MKKYALMLVAAMFAFAMVGCASGADSASESSAAEESSAATETVVQGEIAWSDAKNAKAAAKDAGIDNGFTVPSKPPIGDYKWSKPNFTAMDKVVQADYDGGEACASIRKGQGVKLKDLSADLNDYKADWTQEVQGIEITCHGYEKGTANFLEWTYEDCAYNVWCVSTGDGNIGMNEKEVAAMVEAIN